MSLYSWILCSSLLGMLGAQKAVELSVLVDGQNQYLHVNGQSTEPYYAASLFCESHNLNLSVEGSSCTTLLAEEVISLGGWFVPWILPPRDLIRLVPGQLIATQVEHFCQGYTLSDTACASLQVEVEAFVNDGPGIFSIGSDRKHPIYIPVHYPSTAPRVTIVVVDVDADMSINVTIGVGVDVQWASQRLCVSYYRDHVSACNVSSIEAQIKESLDRGTGDEESRRPQWQLVTPLVSLDVELLDHDRGSNGDRSSMARVLLFDRNGAAGPNRAAAAFCAQHLCQDRINTVRQVAASLKTEVAKARGSHFSATDATDESVGQNDGVRLVVSLSSLPRRLDHLAPIIRRFLSVQTLLPSALYVALPRRSLRERRPYPALPAGWPFHDTGPDSGESKFQNGSAPIVRVLRVDTDWGPATKLIPVLAEETEPGTIIVTIDDDMEYPPSLLEDLVSASEAYPNAAVGFRGYRLLGAPYRHPNFHYHSAIDLPTATRAPLPQAATLSSRSGSSASALSVDVLGGVMGVAYRSGFFDLDALQDYAHAFDWVSGRQEDQHGSSDDGAAGAAFFVDDDWIASALDRAGVQRLVACSASPASEVDDSLSGISSSGGGCPSAHALEQEGVVLSHVAELDGLNGKSHSFRNMGFQESFLTLATQRGGLFRNSHREFF